MYLVIIGGKSAYKIEEIVKTNLDYVRIAIYPTINDFVSSMNMRKTQVDRLFLLQDAIEVLPNYEDVLHNFHNYFVNEFQAARLVTLINDKDMHENLVTLLDSPLIANLCLPARLKKLVFLDFVTKNLEELRRKYGTISTSDDPDTRMESINKESETPKPTPVKQEKRKKEKKGLFGLFGGRKSKQAQTTDNEVEGDAEETGESPNPSDPSITDESDTDIQYTIVDSNNSTVYSSEETAGDGVSESDFPPHEGTTEETPSWATQEEEEHQSWQSETGVGSGSEDGGKPWYEEGDNNNVPDWGSEPEYEENTDRSGTDSESPDSEEADREFAGSFGVVSDEEPESDSPSDSERVDFSDHAKRLTEMAGGFKSDIPALDNADVPVRHIPSSVPLDSVEEEALSFGNIDSMVDDFKKQNERVVEVEVERVVEVEVERVVERVVEVPKIIQGGGKRTYKNGVRILIFTGDRKSGVTRNALNTAKHYAKNSRVLYVDFDIVRKGSVHYLGLQDVAEEKGTIQNGLFTLRDAKVLPNVVHYTKKGNFDCLLSMFGSSYEEEQLEGVATILSSQRNYTTVIVDCPMENLRYLQDIVYYSEVFVTVHSDTASVLNTVLALNSVFTGSKSAPILHNNSNFVVTSSDSTDKFKNSLIYLADLFSFEDQDLDWSKVPILGIEQNMREILEAF